MCISSACRPNPKPDPSPNPNPNPNPNPSPNPNLNPSPNPNPDQVFRLPPASSVFCAFIGTTAHPTLTLTPDP